MSKAKGAAVVRRHVIFLLLAGPLSTAQATVRSFDSERYESRAISCEYPVKLTHDCSEWLGATRPIAFGGHRMNIAAGTDGHTVMLSQIRPGPDHNGFRFRAGPRGRYRERLSLQAIRCIGNTLEDEGIHLKRIQPVRRGRRAAAYYLEFSGNAYDILKHFTVLESEHWLPKRR